MKSGGKKNGFIRFLLWVLKVCGVALVTYLIVCAVNLWRKKHKNLDGKAIKNEFMAEARKGIIGKVPR